MIRSAIAAEIIGLETAKQWVKGMEDAGLVFHFEDDPAEVVNQGGRTFTDEEVPVVRDRVAALYSFDWAEFGCPIGYLLSLEGRACSPTD